VGGDGVSDSDRLHLCFCEDVAEGTEEFFLKTSLLG
jgi:hypothetical protein